MSSGKLAAQAVHAALALPKMPHHSVVVLEVSNKKFEEAKNMVCPVCVEIRLKEPDPYCEICNHTGKVQVRVIRDAGYTEVEPGTETCLAFYEPDPREEK